jgi:integrase/recombinase XerD
MMRPFVETRVVDGKLDWKTLLPKHVIDFVLAARDGRPIGSAKLTVTALRSLLTYLHIEVFIAQPLEMVVPSVAGWRLAGLPRALEAGDVQRLLAACDRRTRSGRRDFAMLRLLARLGLRAGEVAKLDLADIDWRASELVVRGKGQRIERLPLPADVGDALAAYLQRGRPDTAQRRTVFLRIRAPHRALSSTGVTDAVTTAASRAGLDHVRAHRLRHTLASQMLRRCTSCSLSSTADVTRFAPRVT